MVPQPGWARGSAKLVHFCTTPARCRWPSWTHASTSEAERSLEGKKELVGFQRGYRESTQSLLVDLKSRGLTDPPELAVGDGSPTSLLLARDKATSSPAGERARPASTRSNQEVSAFTARCFSLPTRYLAMRAMARTTAFLSSSSNDRTTTTSYPRLSSLARMARSFSACSGLPWMWPAMPSR